MFMQDYRINFSDDTSALIVVTEDEQPTDVAIALCETEGWDTEDIVSITLEKGSDRDI